jgi:autoinducer 2-degrading protein
MRPAGTGRGPARTGSTPPPMSRRRAWPIIVFMWIVHVQVHVKAEHVEEFRKATIENAGNSVKEPGIARFDVIQEVDDPTRFVLVEVYRDKDATVKHKETAHYNAWVEKVTHMLAEPRTRVAYSNVFPADGGW